MPGPFAWLAQSDYAQAVRRVFPRGRAWPDDPGTEADAIKQGIADAAAGVHSYGATLIETESDPTQTILLLPDWEKDWSLPDPCTPLGATTVQRRSALIGKLTATGGANLAYLVSVAAAYGYAVTARYGVSGDGSGWQWLIVISAAALNQQFFYSGSSASGDYLSTYGNATLECVLNQIKPAHKTLQFVYS